ncbi:hypothetical protein ACYVVD_09075 [Arenicellales bacterium IMCC58067]
MNNRRSFFTIFGSVLGILPAAALAFSNSTTFFTSKVEVPKGSSVQINQPLTIKSGNSKVYMQRGQAMSRIEHTYEPYCYFATKRPKSEMETTATLRPAIFTVTKEYRLRDQTASLPYLSAGLTNNGIDTGSSFWLAGANAGGPLNLNYYMKLSNTSQSPVTALVCGIYAQPDERGIPTLDEMTTAVGALATISVAD